MSGGMPKNDVVNADNKYVQIHVFDQNICRAKKKWYLFSLLISTPLSKIMRAYCRIVNRSFSELQFRRLNDGHIITETDTAASLQLENGAEIEVLDLVRPQQQQQQQQQHEQQQQIQTATAQNDAHAAPTAVEKIVVRVLGTNDTVTNYLMKKDKPLGKLMHSYCDMANLSFHAVRFRLNGNPFGEEATPASLQMEDNDCIEVFEKQDGGCTSTTD